MQPVPFRIVALIMSLVIMVCALMACAVFNKGNVQTATVELALCVLQHDKEPYDQIARDCGNVAVTEIIAIVNAADAREARRATRRDGGADSAP